MTLFGPRPVRTDKRATAANMEDAKALEAGGYGGKRPVLSSFVTDTVFPLAGGAPHWLRYDNMASPLSRATRLGRRAVGTTNPLTRGVVLDKHLPSHDPNGPAVQDYDADYVASHEMGHEAAFRGRLPEMDRIAAANYRYASPISVAGMSPREYKAELFRTATGLIRGAMRDVGGAGEWKATPDQAWEALRDRAQETESTMPGAGEAVALLLAQPLFKDSAITDAMRREALRSTGVRTRSGAVPAGSVRRAPGRAPPQWTDQRRTAEASPMDVLKALYLTPQP